MKKIRKFGKETKKKEKKGGVSIHTDLARLTRETTTSSTSVSSRRSSLMEYLAPQAYKKKIKDGASER